MTSGGREVAGEGGPGGLERVDEADRLRDEERDFRRDLRQTRGVAGALSLVALTIGLRDGAAEGFALVVLATVAVLALWAVGVWGIAEWRAPARLRGLRRRLELLDDPPEVPKGESAGEPLGIDEVEP